MGDKVIATTNCIPWWTSYTATTHDWRPDRSGKKGLSSTQIWFSSSARICLCSRECWFVMLPKV